MAGRGGLNLTHCEPLRRASSRATARRGRGCEPASRRFPPDGAGRLGEGLGQPTFVGLERPRLPEGAEGLAAAARLAGAAGRRGVRFACATAGAGWDDDGALRFATPAGAVDGAADARCWRSAARAGRSSARTAAGPALLPAGRRRRAPAAGQCGFAVGWSRAFPRALRRRAAEAHGAVASAAGACAARRWSPRYGIEGGAVYALSAPLRDAIARDGAPALRSTCGPISTPAALARGWRRRAAAVAVEPLRKAAGLLAGRGRPAARGAARSGGCGDPAPLAGADQGAAAAPDRRRRRSRAPSPSAGGVRLRRSSTTHFMLRRRPGVFVAGEMLDWEAPTGGYLLQACFATGAAAGRAGVAWCRSHRSPSACAARSAATAAASTKPKSERSIGPLPFRPPFNRTAVVRDAT